jgi:single-strand DNA-binding protein
MELNKVFLVGNLTRDPELRYLPSGDAACEFDIGVNRTYKDRNGERKQESFFIRIKTYKGIAEFCSNYLNKGKAVFVEGRLAQQTWEAQDGQRRYRMEVNAERVQFAYPRSLEGGGASAEGAADDADAGHAAPDAGSAGAAPAASQGREAGAQDDLPF